MNFSGHSLIDFGRPMLRWQIGRAALRIERRTVVLCALLVVAIVVLSVIALGTGSLAFSPIEVIRALVDPNSDPKAHLVVVTWRLPRVLFAIVCGTALAMSGAIFQSLTKNPLGSPDVIGFASGSYAGACVVLLVLGTANYLEVAAGSLAGGLATAVIVYLLAYRRGVRAFRLIVVGIAVGAFLGSLTSMLLLSVNVQQAMLAAVWGAGSLSGLGFDQLGPAAIIFVVLCLLTAPLGRPLNQLELGDDAAQATGSRVGQVRLSATIIGVALTALVTAAAGPIAFVALAAPQIARRLTHASTVQLLPSALTGAALLVAADIVAQRIALPVGVVTVCSGGAYLAWLLAREYKSHP